MSPGLCCNTLRHTNRPFFFREVLLSRHLSKRARYEPISASLSINGGILNGHLNRWEVLCELSKSDVGVEALLLTLVFDSLFNKCLSCFLSFPLIFPFLARINNSCVLSISLFQSLLFLLLSLSLSFSSPFNSPSFTNIISLGPYNPKSFPILIRTWRVSDTLALCVI